MTCIAYRDGTMAADSLMTISNVKTACIKITKRNGHLIGLSGNDCPALADFVDAFVEQDDEARKLMKDYKFSALVITPQGELQLWDERLCFEPLTAPFYAIGSGADFAIGAMHMGASAVQGVRAAIKWCTTVGGAVVTRKL